MAPFCMKTPILSNRIRDVRKSPLYPLQFGEVYRNDASAAFFMAALADFYIEVGALGSALAAGETPAEFPGRVGVADGYGIANATE